MDLSTKGANPAIMSDWIRRSGKARGLFALLALCVLAIRIAIPTGFMPTQSAHGIVISLCTGEGAKTAMLPMDGKTSDHHKAADGECAFAAGLGGGMLGASLSVPFASVPLPAALVSSRAIADLTVHRLAAPPPPAQAPPALI